MRNLILLPVFAIWFIPLGASAQGNNITEWQKDIDFIVNKIEEFHPNPWFRISRESFLDNANQIKNNLERLTEEQRIVKTMQLVASLGDGHTYLFPWTHKLFYHWFPVRTERFEDGIFITGIDSEYKDYVGMEITRIGRLSADSCFNLMGSVTSVDNPLHFERTVPSVICNATVLIGLGIIDNRELLELSVKDKSGNDKRIVIDAVGYGTDGGWANDKSAVWGSKNPVTVFDNLKGNLPIALEKNMSSRSNYWFKELKEEEAIYFQYNRCFNSEEPFKDFNHRMWSVYEANPTGYDKLIVDLRYNGGGDGTLHKDFLTEVIKHPEINKRGHLFIITGRETFSAGSKLIAEMLAYTNAITVGEPAGPINWFSDTEQLVLPSGGMGTIHISRMYWQYGHPYDNKGYLSPEFPVQVSFKDYSTGKDKALELILKKEIRALKDFLFEEGFKSFSEKYKNWSEKYSKQNWWFPYNEFDLRLMGVDLFTNGKKEDAIQLFSFLTNRYPDISWGLQILGNLYAAIGDYENGLACYEKAYSINPDCYYTLKDGRNIAMNCYKNRIISAFGSGGITSIKNLYLELIASSHWDVFERLLINAANDYLKTEKTTDVIKILQLNTELNPKSPLAFQSLGEAYYNLGNKKQAIKYLKKSILLDTNNSEAMELLSTLGVK